jgi:hypothetical protein
MVAISGSVHPARASRVTAVPRRSLNVTPAMPTFAHALRHDARKPSGVHGRLSVELRMIGPCFVAASSAALSGAPTGMTTRAPVFDCRSRIRARMIARQTDLAPVITELKSAGVTSLLGVARALTDRGIPTARGGSVWTAVQVSRVLTGLFGRPIENGIVNDT